MPQHRTRKQKESPNYSFLVSWKPDPEARPGTFVKGQLKNQIQAPPSHARMRENANLLDKNDTFVLVRREAAKSLILAGFIIALELVIYLASK